MASSTPAPTTLSDLIAEKMNEKNLSIRGLAETLDITYEHARRIVRGESVPPPNLRKQICTLLNIERQVADELAVGAKIREKYGDIPLVLSGKNPELEPIERVWNQLTESQKQDAISLIQGWAKRNKAMR